MALHLFFGGSESASQVEGKACLLAVLVGEGVAVAICIIAVACDPTEWIRDRH